MTTLHIVSASPDSGSALQDCLAAAQPDAAILLTENGVYAILHPHALEALLEAAQRGIRIFALTADVQARGLALANTHSIAAVDYAGFVRLVTDFERSVTWA